MAGIYNPSITQRLNGLVEKERNRNKRRFKYSKLTIGDIGNRK